jgi:hypothetical protein
MAPIRRRAAIAALLVLTGCGAARGNDGPTADVLYLRSARGVAVVEAGAKAPSFKGYATPSGDWSTAVSSLIGRGRTSLKAVDPRSGALLWAHDLDGRLVVKLVSADGDTVVLSPVRQRHYLTGRQQTRLIVYTRSMREPHTVTIPGNYEPEALSVDGSTLFAIRYLPARSPNRYQVRQLDIASGKVGGVYTPDAHLQEAMGGRARVQTGSSDGTRLYTLYTLGAGDSKRAFIHTLALDEKWAHCIDLPPSFATKAQWATALALSPDGTRLYITNSATGRLAEIDTDSLEVIRTTTLDIVHSSQTTAIHDGASTLYITSGDRVVTVDLESLTQRRSWGFGRRITGLQVAAEAGKLYVGFRDEIATVDPTTGEEIDSIDPPGVNNIQELGPVYPQMEGTGQLTCAC